MKEGCVNSLNDNLGYVLEENDKICNILVNLGDVLSNLNNSIKKFDKSISSINNSEELICDLYEVQENIKKEYRDFKNTYKELERDIKEIKTYNVEIKRDIKNLNETIEFNNDKLKSELLLEIKKLLNLSPKSGKENDNCERKTNNEDFSFWQLEQLAEKGDPDAQFKLGMCYYNGEETYIDYQEAVKWYKQAANQGNVDAQYYLGECYEKGLGVNKSSIKSKLFYRKAAEQGYEKAKKSSVK